MGARRTGRERALQALYQLEVSSPASLDEALAAAWAAHSEEGTPAPEARRFAEDLAKGVCDHMEEIDALIQEHSHNWRLDRMGRIDRNVLRLGIYELRHRDDIPRKVTLNEMIELAKAFGSETSSAFINGLLDRVAVALQKA
ncbi:MAG TPA: transcription antitermination factor NusB [Myxococcaceae bacterium]|nr:transcription antitermination factor NusB [Myxococcaceae bacterium]